MRLGVGTARSWPRSGSNLQRSWKARLRWPKWTQPRRKDWRTSGRSKDTPR
ncbi:unnamed protein product [Symbiodinium natans]|uniref:Uncharacterized protein n=1 Tax=Symbiodinium natans TaxID=878477 RepID=A0A812SAX3_9DINO|nr:unnamed protein product [Symbiodinium natans]